MPPRKVRQLVIDTNIARSAGGEGATHPTPKVCRDFLLTMRENTPHQIVMSPEIRAEWDKHQSGFARTWRRSMMARRRVVLAGSCTDNELRQRVEAAEPNDKNCAAILKDFMLVEAARATDKTIVSMDETVRELLRKVAQPVAELRGVVWLNPTKPEENGLEWLKNGTGLEKERTLGYKAPKSG